MSSPSPVTDGTHVWVMTGTGILKAFDFAGKELWARDIQKDYGRFGLNWGYGSSPLLHEDALYVQVLHGMKHRRSVLRAADRQGHRQDGLARRAADHARASSRRTPTPRRRCCATAAATEIVVTGGDVVTGHDPATGKELWRADGLNPDNDGNYRIVASPVVHGDIDLRAVARAADAGAQGRAGAATSPKSHLLWSFHNGPDVPTPVTDGTYLYVVNDRGIVWCLDAKTGKEVYGRQRLQPGTYSGSPVLADGKIYVTNEDGVTSVVQGGPEVRAAGGERPRRLHAQLARGLRRTDLHPHEQVPLRHRTAP